MKKYYVQVRFRNGERKYCYMSFIKVKKGDTVIVNSANGVGLAQVMEPDVTDKNIQAYATAYILDVVDLKAHKAKIEEYKKL